jgi:hypothetical protein
MSELAKQAARLYDENDTEQLLRVARDLWPGEGEAMPEGVAEVCRYAYIRSVELNLIEQHLWRARAQAAAVIEGARDTAAGLLLQPFFVTVDVALKGAQQGHEHGFQRAREILDLITLLVPADHPRASLFRRLQQEKRAFTYLMEGTDGGRPSLSGLSTLKQAEREYVTALAMTTGDDRGRLKVRGGLALAGYLQLAHSGEVEVAAAKRPFVDETRDILNAAEAAGFADVAAWSARNLAVMEQGEFEDWAPYEVT